MIPLYTLCTPSHEVFLEEFFLPTVDPEFDLHLIRAEQQGGWEFATEGWHNNVRQKLAMFADAVRDHSDGEIVMFTDVDMIFVKPYAHRVPELLGECEIINQGECNSGFFAVRITENVRICFELLRRFPAEYTNRPPWGDQYALNFLAPLLDRANGFPRHEVSFAHYARFVLDDVLAGKEKMPISEHLAVLHPAGLPQERKIQILKVVKEQVYG